MDLSGEYVVLFKDPDNYEQHPQLHKFIGSCENFVPAGLCAFTNDTKEMLLVRYKDIIQMRLKK